MSDYNDVITKLSSFAQDVGYVMVFFGGISGIIYTSNAAVSLWKKINNGGHSSHGVSYGGDVIAIVIGSIITIFSIIIGFFSLVWE